MPSRDNVVRPEFGNNRTEGNLVGGGQVILTEGHDNASWQEMLDKKAQRDAKIRVDENSVLREENFSFAEKLAQRAEKVMSESGEARKTLSKLLCEYLGDVNDENQLYKDMGNFMLENVKDVLSRDFPLENIADAQQDFQFVLYTQQTSDAEMISLFSKHRAIIMGVEDMIDVWVDAKFNPSNLEHYNEDRANTKFLILHTSMLA